MRFDGQFVVTPSPDRVLPILLDVEAVAGCVPGVEAVQAVGPDGYRGLLKVRLGPIATAFELTGTQAPRADGCSVDLRGRERLTDTLVEAHFDATLSAGARGTSVAWALDLTLRGRLGQLGGAVLDDVARRTSAQTVICLKQRIEGA